MRRSIYLFVVSLIAVWSGFTSGQAQLKPGNSQQNASFLSRRFLTDTKNAAALTDDFLPKADHLYKVQLLFPNGGLLDSTGTLDHAPFAAKVFLDHVSAHEKTTGVAFKLMPYLNGYSLQDTAHAANLRLDLNDPVVRSHIVVECGRYVSASVPGSYVTGPRVFDGIVLDIEPAGDPAFFASLKTLVAEIRASFDGMGLRSKTLGVAAPQYTARVPKPNWGWDSSDYYYIARYVNYVIAMTYDSGLKDGPAYQSWITEETTRILQGVSGATWNFDSAHPKPVNGVKVLIGLPGFYTVSKAHNPEAENVVYGAAGLKKGLSLLQEKDRVSLGFIEGATMYTHDGGAPDSIYARYDKDWSWWKQYWIGR